MKYVGRVPRSGRRSPVCSSDRQTGFPALDPHGDLRRGQTHAIVRYGLETLLPQGITMVHGPGCPVCVTPLEMVDLAVHLAADPRIVFCSFGDMLRVPGSQRDLLSVKAQGGDVRMVYSPLDAVKLAIQHPEREVVFFAVGFETTAPANAMAVKQAEQQQVKNFSLLGLPRVGPARDVRPPLLPGTPGCKGSWRRDTSARSWGTGSTNPSPRNTVCPLW